MHTFLIDINGKSVGEIHSLNFVDAALSSLYNLQTKECETITITLERLGRFDIYTYQHVWINSYGELTYEMRHHETILA